ncbi:MAG: toll/interleukin-1 receptor domain-containing protein, partial [Pirellula sp.]
MPKVFLSFSHFDRDQALLIVNELEQDHHDCWAYTSDSIAGTDYLEEVTKGIQECDVFVILITEKSIESHQVNKEVR